MTAPSPETTHAISAHRGDPTYPFSALVGQAPMKRALILAAIHPGISGVLIRGSKGAAKSTAVRTLTAYDGRTDVTHADVEAMAELTLAHRRTTPGTPPPPSGDPPPAPDRPDATPPVLYADRERRGMLVTPDRHGLSVRPRLPKGRAHDPALLVTLGAAAPWPLSRGRGPGQPLLLRGSDLRDKVRVRRRQHLILFVVDASRSMGTRQRMVRTKGAVLSQRIDAYQKRERVSLIAFSGTPATLALPPLRSVRLAARRLNVLPIGSLTPLAQGLALAERTITAVRRREPGIAPLVVLLADGRGNVPRQRGGNPEADAQTLARRFGRNGVAGLIIDTEEGPVRIGLASRLARAWDAEVLSLDALGEQRSPDVVRRTLFAGQLHPAAMEENPPFPPILKKSRNSDERRNSRTRTPRSEATQGPGDRQHR